jgi:hypothetical protein
LDHDTDVSSPDHQISRLGPLDSLKPLGTNVELRRGSIPIGEASLLINGMNEMRTIALGMTESRIKRRR